MNPPTRMLRLIAVPAMLLAGALVAVQSSINGQLGAQLGTGARAGFAAALISFGSGLVMVAVICAALPGGRAGVQSLVRGVRSGALHPVQMIGGAFGAFLVATQGLTVGTIGVALFSIAVTAGQSASALAVDHFGLGPSGRQSLSVPRLVAAAFAICAVVLAAGERLVESFGWHIAFFAFIALAAGAGTAVQQALNGRLNAVGGPWSTTLNNFVVGTTVLTGCFVLSLVAPGELDGPPRAWWLYLGGVIGVGFIWLAAVLVRVHGVLVLSLSMIAGNVLGAEILEILSGAMQVGWVGIAAGGLTLLGVAIALLARRSGISHI